MFKRSPGSVPHGHVASFVAHAPDRREPAPLDESRWPKEHSHAETRPGRVINLAGAIATRKRTGGPPPVKFVSQLSLVLCCFQTNKKQGASPQMQSTPRERLLQFAHVLQSSLFERLELE